MGIANGMPERNYCNGCDSTGKSVNWPTLWKQHPGDIVPIESVTDEQYAKFFRVVINTRTFGGEAYLPWKPSGEMFVELEMPPLEWLKTEYSGYLAVIVDNHS